MHKWIFTKPGLSRSQRIKLWYQCVYPCMTPGILAAGVDQTTLTQFDSFSLHSLRKIVSQPVHLELLSNTDFLARYRLRDPLVMLRQLCIKMIDRIQTRNLTLDSHDILLTGSTDQASAHLIREIAKIKGPSPHFLPPHFRAVVVVVVSVLWSHTSVWVIDRRARGLNFLPVRFFLICGLSSSFPTHL